jgi:ABC-type nitrate/sulfonate/bicarbonate transport system permease component
LTAGVIAAAEEDQGAASGPAALSMSHWRLRYRRLEPALLGTACIVLFLALWQIAVEAGWIDRLFVSSPWDVAKQMWEYVRTDQFARDLKSTSITFGDGLGLSVVVGLVFGVAMGLFKRVGYFFDYFISLLYASPRIALVPTFILWFGIGRQTGVAMVFLMSAFPIAINTMTGVRNVDPTLIEMARSQTASRMQLIRTVVIPASFPQIVSGVRLAIGTALIGVVVAEFLAGNSSGLGYTMQVAAQNFQAAQVFVGLVMISVLGLVLTQILAMVERYFQRWRTS